MILNKSFLTLLLIFQKFLFLLVFCQPGWQRCEGNGGEPGLKEGTSRGLGSRGAGVVWCGVVSCGVVSRRVVTCRGVVWCGELWCAVVWCGWPRLCREK